MIEAISGLAAASSVTTVQGLADSYGSWSGIRTNHVVSKSGDFFDESGSSRGLSTREDLELLIALRRISDLVIVDAATARREQYRKLSSSHLALVSLSGNFDVIPAAQAEAGVTLFSPKRPTSENDVLPEHVIISGSDPFGEILSWAKMMKMDSLLLEAGPTLTRVCFETSQVCQSAITVTPRVPTELLTSLWNPFSDSGSLSSIAESESATFTLWSY